MLYCNYIHTAGTAAGAVERSLQQPLVEAISILLIRAPTTRMAQASPYSNYFYALSKEMKSRYIAKISLINSQDPYTLNKAEFTKDPDQLPLLGYIATIDALRLHTSINFFF